MICTMCDNELAGLQTKYCSRKCKGKDPANQKNTYVKQQVRAKNRKLQAIAIKGGKCIDCGYKKNYSAMAFHHTQNNKSFGIDARSLSNRTWELILIELDKCVLVCHNCHMERHHPQCEML